MTLTDEQRHFAEHAREAFVEACPGAGKTRTILARLAHIAKSLPPRRGVAVLSFTNKAIEEFKLRSAPAGVGEMLRHPGFVGTFDSFVRHFLFAPAGIVGSSTRPHVVESWDSLEIEVRLRGNNAFAGPGVSLDLFNPETNAINPDLIAHIALRRHVSGNKTSYEAAAQSYRQNLNRKGYFSALDARTIALRGIRQERWGLALGRALAGRFQEIVVDEAQDCNPLDLEVLAWLRSSRIRVSMVCDMDQSIYAFRDGERVHLEAFANTYATEDRLTLTGNFRSSPAICSLAASLRTRTEADAAAGEKTREITTPIAIYPYNGRTVTPDIGQWFIAHAESETIGLSRSELIVLAHSERAARIASGSASATAGGKSKVERLARAVGEFWAGTTRYGKSLALSSIERLLLDIAGQRDEGEPVSHAVQRLSLNSRLLRRQALELVMGLPRTCADTDMDRAAWINYARNMIQELGIAVPSGQTIRSVIRSGGPGWSSCLGQTAANAGLQYSTVHNAKGGEYEGVCVVVPPDHARSFGTHLLAAWANRSDDEPKRVIYVGVTRARRLAALAIPSAFLTQLVAILQVANVPYAVFDPGRNSSRNEEIVDLPRIRAMHDKP